MRRRAGHGWCWSRDVTLEELQDRLQKHEWADIEFKKARRSVPQDAYKTVSAFANTAGGWLVFGVQEASGGLDIVGVVEVDKVQNDFLSTLRAGDKLNRVIAVAEDAHEVDGKTLLVFHVPESQDRTSRSTLAATFANPSSAGVLATNAARWGRSNASSGTPRTPNTMANCWTWTLNASSTPIPCAGIGASSRIETRADGKSFPTWSSCMSGAS